MFSLYPMLRFILSCACLSWVVVLHAADAVDEYTTVEIDYKSAVYDFSGEQKKVVLEGPITIRTNTLLVTCDHAVILSSRKQSSSTSVENSNLGSIDFIHAKGNVVIEQAGSKALAGLAKIYPSERKLILEDNPRIIDQYGTVSGHRIVFLQGERKIKIESGEEQKRSRIQLNNVAEVGFLMGDEAPPPEESGE